MSEYKTFNNGSSLGGDIRSYNSGEIVIEGKPYGKIDGDHIYPYVYGNPTLIIDTYGYVIGLDGIKYGKLVTFGNEIKGVEVFTSPFKNEVNNAPSNSGSFASGSFGGFVVDKAFDAYSRFESKPKSKGYANGVGIKGKIFAGIIVVSGILIFLYGLLSDIL